jgi:hypothetical protein
MSDEWLNWLVTAGQIGAIVLAILAAVAGDITGDGTYFDVRPHEGRP